MLCSSMWKVTLTEWRHKPGMFIYILPATIEAARYAPQRRLLKSMLKTANFHLVAYSSNGQEIIYGMLSRFSSLHKWLRNKDTTIAAKPTGEFEEYECGPQWD
jgi:hypothetical protein